MTPNSRPRSTPARLKLAAKPTARPTATRISEAATIIRRTPRGTAIIAEPVKDAPQAMEQATFSELDHDLKKRRTQREVFLEKMDRLVPWERLEGRIEPFYPKPGRGHRPYPLRKI